MNNSLYVVKILVLLSKCKFSLSKGVSCNYCKLQVLVNVQYVGSRTSLSQNRVSVRVDNLATLYNNLYYFMSATNIHKHIYFGLNKYT